MAKLPCAFAECGRAVLVNGFLFDPDAESGVSVSESSPSSDSEREDLRSRVNSQDEGFETEGSEEPPSSEGPSEGPSSEPSREPPPSYPSTLFDRLRDDFGVDLSDKYQDEGELLKGLVNAQKMVGQRDEDAQIGKRVRPYLNEFQQWLQGSQEQQEAQPQSEESEKSWFERVVGGKVPEWDPSWNKYITQDPQTGEEAFSENTPVDVRNAIQKRQQAYQKWSTLLVTDPERALRPAMEQWEQEIRNKVFEEIEGRQTQQESWQEAQSLLKQNDQWMFQRNAKGDPVYDASGQRVMTPQGQSYTKHVLAMQNVIPEQKALDEYARLKVKEEFGTLNGQSPPSPPSTAKSQPSRSQASTETGKKTRSTKGQSLREKLLANSGVSDSPGGDTIGYA